MTASPAPQSVPSSLPSRRRQRSVRLLVAVLLLALAAALVGASLLDNVPVFRAVAAIAAVVLGAVATRITHTEVLQSRRDGNRDRAEQAVAYADLTAARNRENAEFIAGVQARIVARETHIDELERALTKAHQDVAAATKTGRAAVRRAEHAESEVDRISRSLERSETQAADAIVRVAELEAEIDTLRSELASWKAELQAQSRARSQSA